MGWFYRGHGKVSYLSNLFAVDVDSCVSATVIVPVLSFDTSAVFARGWSHEGRMLLLAELDSKGWTSLVGLGASKS